MLSEYDTKKIQSGLQEDKVVYKSYRKRWFVLLAVLTLNIANYSHWISYASVLSKAAEFYQVSHKDIQLILIISYSLGIPCACVATFILTKHGLRVGLLVGASLTLLGGFLCCLSTFPGIREHSSPKCWYFMTLIGQALTGIASPFISCVPTKVSQHWFNEKQRPMATGLLGLSNVIGLVIGQALTPLIVKSYKNVPIMNIVWFVPALLGAILTFFSVTSSKPPTPPTPSAALESDSQNSMNYVQILKSVLTNKPYLVLVLVIGLLVIMYIIQ